MTDNEPGLDSRTSITGDPARNALSAVWPIGRKATRNRTEMTVMKHNATANWFAVGTRTQPLLALCLIWFGLLASNKPLP